MHNTSDAGFNVPVRCRSQGPVAAVLCDLCDLCGSGKPRLTSFSALFLTSLAKSGLSGGPARAPVR